MNDYELRSDILTLNGAPVLSGLPANVTLVDDPQGVGVFLQFAAEKPLSRHVFALGDLHGGPRLTFAHRYEPFWMKAAVGTKGGDVLPETQFLLCEWSGSDAAKAKGDKPSEATADDATQDSAPDADANLNRDANSAAPVDLPVVLFVPILDGDMRASLQGAGEHGLELVAETGDPAVCADTIVGLFIAAHTDPYTLMEQAARGVMARMGTGRLRRDKPLPAWINDFGWCTWDAFYQEVSKEKVQSGLESFRRIGITPRLLILDDGWQSIEQRPSGEKRLTAFAANERFPGGLAPTVRMTKDEYGVRTFLVWHALHGYWGGVDEDKLPGYEARGVERRSSPGIVYHQPAVDRWWGPVVGVVSPRSIYRFYQDYHSHLRAQGVDGVKVDSQATLESVSHGSGGRVSMMRHYHAALEGSVQTQFSKTIDDWQYGASLINCMSCSSEMLYSALASNLTRTSTDFWPRLPASHGEHLYINALVSLWFGEFVHPDWDMFQSGHEMGAFHAMGRAVGGCPVYVSDKPDAHDAALLHKLVLSDGTVARCADPGRPTRDCLFHDPTKEDVLLKIFNRNHYFGGDSSSGVVGIFNARYHAPGTDAVSDSNAPMPDMATHSVRGYVSPADARSMTGVKGASGKDGRFVVYRHTTGEHRVMRLRDRWEIELGQLTGDVFTIMPVRNGFAPIGMTGMFNSAGAISWDGLLEREGTRRNQSVYLRKLGRFAAWCENQPARVLSEGEETPFLYDAQTGLLQVEVPPPADPARFVTEFKIEW